MKALLQNFKTGDMTVADVPPPVLGPGRVLVHNVASLVSAGTERAVVELARMNLLQKARARPDLVRRVLRRVSKDGLLGTARMVRNLIDTTRPLGYSCAGIVEAVGSGIADIQPGMRVACAGAGHANHAEVVAVPRNLVVPVPDGVGDQDAAFVTVGAIALHGVRQADLAVGECVVVIGLGLVGQLTVQICAAAGCRVFGIDTDAGRVALARDLGAAGGGVAGAGDVEAAARDFSRGLGADAVLITAGTTSNEPIETAAAVARDRARVVAVGDVGLEVPRRPYYAKELDLRLSRSYGPGRYDPAYEEGGHDYPVGYVRWTENRNMEAFLDLIAAGKVRIEPLITHRFPVEEAEDAYALLSGESSAPPIGIVLAYDAGKTHASTVDLVPGAPAARPGHGAGTVRFGIIGAGHFAQAVLLPALGKISGAAIHGIATASGITARGVAERHGAAKCTSDYHELLADPEVDAVLIATRHDLHAEATAAAITAGKHVLVEKPLAIDEAGLARVCEAHDRAASSADGAPQVLVGFNRRFSPLAATLRDAVSGTPLVMTYRVNAGPLPADSWQRAPDIGGGRIVGEVCHFIDLFQFLTGAGPIEVMAGAAGGDGPAPGDPDNLAILVRLDDGSVGTIVYAADGDPDFPKERVEVFGGGVTGVIDDWRELSIQGRGRTTKKRPRLESAKGHAEELAAFVASVRSGTPAVPFASHVATTLATFAVQRSLREGAPAAVAFGGAS